MRAALVAVPSSPKGRAQRKGEIKRALPIAFIAALLLSGVTTIGSALYIPIKAQLAQVLLDRAFDQSLQQGSPVKPWSWADTAPIARLEVPRLDAQEIVLSGGSGEAMAFGPTALIDDRRRGISILAAHRDTHFAFVKDLTLGDNLSLERTDGSVEQYEITHFETVQWDSFTYPAHGGEGLLALTTCYPFGTDMPGPLRRVAWARRIN